MSQTLGQSQADLRRVAVWDIPTRLFHWTLLVLVVTSWLTGEEEGAAAIHRVSGGLIAGLLVFRLIWGFIGGEHARFADFAAGPATIVRHVRDLLEPQPKRRLGHNPLGGVAVFLLLANVAVLVATGLLSGGEHNAGPFAGFGGLELSEVHEAAFRVLQVLVAIHIAGVVFETWRAKDALVPAMITGRKTRRRDEPGADARVANPWALIVAIAFGLAVSAALIAQAPADPVRYLQGGSDRE